MPSGDRVACDAAPGFRAEDPAVVGKELINATAKLTEVQTELGIKTSR
jgi:hypothetical protein